MNMETGHRILFMRRNSLQNFFFFFHSFNFFQELFQELSLLPPRLQGKLKDFFPIPVDS